MIKALVFQPVPDQDLNTTVDTAIFKN